MGSIRNGTSEVSLLATGDCGPVHGPNDGFPLERYTELVRPTLASVDLRVGHCERQYSARGEYDVRRVAARPSAARDGADFH